MLCMVDRRKLPDIGDASAYEVELSDGEKVRIVVSKANRSAIGDEEAAFSEQLRRTIAGRNSWLPKRSSRSFV